MPSRRDSSSPPTRPGLGLLVLAEQQHHPRGITADLEAMKRVGIGGVLIMEVDQGAPVGPAAFMSDRWRSFSSSRSRKRGGSGSRST